MASSPSLGSNDATIKPFPFLDLPAEIRVLVYKRYSDYIYDPPYDHACKKHSCSPETDSHLISLLYTNKQIYSELLPIIYRHLDFSNLTCAARALAWEQRKNSWAMPREVAMSMRSIRIYLCRHLGSFIENWAAYGVVDRLNAMVRDGSLRDVEIYYPHNDLEMEEEDVFTGDIGMQDTEERNDEDEVKNEDSGGGGIDSTTALMQRVYELFIWTKCGINKLYGLESYTFLNEDIMTSLERRLALYQEIHSNNPYQRVVVSGKGRGRGDPGYNLVVKGGIEKYAERLRAAREIMEEGRCEPLDDENVPVLSSHSEKKKKKKLRSGVVNNRSRTQEEENEEEIRKQRKKKKSGKFPLKGTFCKDCFYHLAFYLRDNRSKRGSSTFPGPIEPSAAELDMAYHWAILHGFKACLVESEKQPCKELFEGAAMEWD